MNTWLILLPSFAIFAVGALFTYVKDLRDSWAYLPTFVTLSLLSGWMWVVASRRLDDTKQILLFSLVWDILMVVAYYAGPLLFKGGWTWQVYVAAAVTAFGLTWFKVATS